MIVSQKGIIECKERDVGHAYFLAAARFAHSSGDTMVWGLGPSFINPLCSGLRRGESDSRSTSSRVPTLRCTLCAAALRSRWVMTALKAKLYVMEDSQ